MSFVVGVLNHIKHHIWSSKHPVYLRPPPTGLLSNFKASLLGLRQAQGQALVKDILEIVCVGGGGEGLA